MNSHVVYWINNNVYCYLITNLNDFVTFRKLGNDRFAFNYHFVVVVKASDFYPNSNVVDFDRFDVEYFSNNHFYHFSDQIFFHDTHYEDDYASYHPLIYVKITLTHLSDKSYHNNENSKVVSEVTVCDYF